MLFGVRHAGTTLARVVLSDRRLKVKVYIVIALDEDDDDYEIVDVFSNKEHAKALAVAVEGQVEEFSVRDAPRDIPDVKVFSIEMSRTGDAVVECLPPLTPRGYRHGVYIGFVTHKDCPWEKRDHWRLFGNVCADSKDEAVAKMVDIRHRILNGERPEGVEMGKN